MTIWETTQKVEILTNRYRLYIAVYFIPATIFMCLVFSEYILHFFARDTFSYAKGDQPLEFCNIEYNGTEVTTVVASWVDKEGSIHYAKEPPQLFGFSVPFIVLLLLNLGVIKVSYDVHRFLASRYRRRLLAEHFPKYFVKSLNL